MYKLSDLSTLCNTDSDKNCTSFINLLKTKWDEIHEKPDVFRYKIQDKQEKIVDGKYLLQLNPNRGIKRRTPELFEDICQPFDGSKFNFTKVLRDEILFSLSDKVDCEHIFLVNVSPISRYHSLLCPFVNKCLPQVITRDSLKLVIDVVFLASDRDLRIGFNSLCAFASVNHLHYHLMMESSTLPVEEINWTPINGPLYSLDKSYIMPAFCFVIQKDFTDECSEDIYKLLSYFLKHSIAHNILITMRGEKEDVVKVIIWPRKRTSGVKKTTSFNIAICELSGWFPVYSQEAYSKLNVEDLESELKKWKIDNFDNLCEQVQCLF